MITEISLTTSREEAMLCVYVSEHLCQHQNMNATRCVVAVCARDIDLFIKQLYPAFHMGQGIFQIKCKIYQMQESPCPTNVCNLQTNDIPSK